MIKCPMIYVLHEHDHFQRILHAAPRSFSMGSWSEACFTDVPPFPAPSETILPNLGSATALWLGMCADGIYKADVHGPVSHSSPTLAAPPNAHCAKMYTAVTCEHLRATAAPPTVPTLGGRNDLAAGGPRSIGPFFPNPRPKAKPPPPHVYEAAGWTLSAWVSDIYICRGIACVHGSPGPDYHCCAMECEVPSECPTSSDEESSSCFHSPRNSNAKPCSKDGHEIHIPQLDLFRGIPGYSALTALRDRARSFSRLAATVLQVAANLWHYSYFNKCGEHASSLWRSNADYWNSACSYSDADLANLQSKAAKAARESFVPWKSLLILILLLLTAPPLAIIFHLALHTKGSFNSYSNLFNLGLTMSLLVLLLIKLSPASANLSLPMLKDSSVLRGITSHMLMWLLMNSLINS